MYIKSLTVHRMHSKKNRTVIVKSIYRVSHRDGTWWESTIKLELYASSAEQPGGCVINRYNSRIACDIVVFAACSMRRRSSGSKLNSTEVILLNWKYTLFFTFIMKNWKACREGLIFNNNWWNHTMDQNQTKQSFTKTPVDFFD